MRARRDPAAEVRILRELIHHHNFRYHVLDNPEISDVEYDSGVGDDLFTERALRRGR